MKITIKEFIKIITINIFAIIMIVFSFDFVVYKKFFSIPIHSKSVRIEHPYIYKTESYYNFRQNIQTFVGEAYKKNPLVLIGCSYTEGHFVDDEKKVHVQLSEYTKRPAYNLGLSGYGPLEALLFLSQKEAKKEIKSPEYVIYTYMYNHPDRLNIMISLYLVRKFGCLPEQNFSQFDRLYMVQLYKAIKWRDYLKEDNENFDRHKATLKNIFKKMNEITKEFSPNSKFAILVFVEDEKFVENKTPLYQNILYSTDFWNELEKEGINVIRTDELLGYKITDGDLRTSPQMDNSITPHPTEKAWQIIVPKLSKKLNLN